MPYIHKQKHTRENNRYSIITASIKMCSHTYATIRIYFYQIKINAHKILHIRERLTLCMYVRFKLTEKQQHQLNNEIKMKRLWVLEQFGFMNT